MLPKKLLRRTSEVVFNFLRVVQTPLLNTLFSLIIVRFFATTLWGELSEIILWVTLFVQLFLWGTKDYTLIEFSRQPRHIASIWWTGMISRLLFIIPGIIFFLLYFDGSAPLRNATIIFFISRGIYLSFESLIIYFRYFSFSFSLEAISFLLLVGILSFINADQIQVKILWLLAFVEILKLILSFFRFSKFLVTERISILPDFKVLLASLPFFLIVMSGFLQSRMNQFCINSMLDSVEIARFQIINNFNLLISALPSILITPYLKNLYHSGSKILIKLPNLLIKWSLIIVPLSVLISWTFVRFIYKLPYSNMELLASLLYCIPVFFYSSIIYFFFKQNKSYLVVIFSLIGAVITLLSSMIFIKILGLTGGLLAGLTGQILMSVLYYFSFKKLRV